MTTLTIPCACCGNELPDTAYSADSLICIRCDRHTKYEAIMIARANWEVEQRVIQRTKAGKKASKRIAKLAQIEQHGKRCSACHAHKPADQYNLLHAAPDGLQPICRTCNEIRAKLVTSGSNGLSLWHATRDALRLASTAPQPASTIKM